MENCNQTATRQKAKGPAKNHRANLLIPNGTDRSRTDDLLRVKQALFQLSYDPAHMVSTVYINRLLPPSAIWPSSGQVIHYALSQIALTLQIFDDEDGA